jgi:hypothetical protein
MRYIELNPVRAQWRPVVEAAIENLRLIDKLINESDPLVLLNLFIAWGVRSVAIWHNTKLSLPVRIFSL